MPGTQMLRASRALAAVTCVAVMMGCQGVTDVVPTGSIHVTVATFGSDFGVDGYRVSVDDQMELRRLGSHDTLTMSGLTNGPHSIVLSGMASNCVITSANPVSVTTSAGAIAQVEYRVGCSPRFGTMRLVVQSDGEDLDVDGYTVSIDASIFRRITVAEGGNGVLFPSLSAGPHVIRLSDVAPNCLTNSDSRSTYVQGGETIDERFVVTCAPLGGMTVRVVTTGEDFAVDGYVLTLSLGAGRVASVVPNDVVVWSKLFPGEYHLELDHLSPNCAPVDGAVREPLVVSGESVDVTFNVSCARASRIVYASVAGGRSDIYAINANGGCPTKLSDGGSDSGPSVSPDGSKVAFESRRDGNLEIYVMSTTDGSDVVRLTNSGGDDYAPAWSPDGTRIAFVSTRTGNSQIHVMNADGSGLTRIRTADARDEEPTWSPDGKRIAFRSGEAGNAAIYAMDANGSGVVQLTTNNTDRAPAWSPDGKKIAFNRESGCDDWYFYDECETNIVVMNADGTGLLHVPSGSQGLDPAWSPDGQWIAFTVGGDLYVMRGDGTRRTQMPATGASNPSWGKR